MASLLYYLGVTIKIITLRWKKLVDLFVINKHKNSITQNIMTREIRENIDIKIPQSIQTSPHKQPVHPFSVL